MKQGAMLSWRDWLICAAILAVLFAVSTREEDPDAFSLWSGYEARQGEVLIQNGTCADYHQYRTVPDPEVKERLLALCQKLEVYRPFLFEDVMVGLRVVDCVELWTEEERYVVKLVDVEEQLALDYVHRDQPIVIYGRYRMTEDGYWHEEAPWYCTLPAAEFAALCQAIRSYSGGEIIVP